MPESLKYHIKICLFYIDVYNQFGAFRLLQKAAYGWSEYYKAENGRKESMESRKISEKNRFVIVYSFSIIFFLLISL